MSNLEHIRNFLRINDQLATSGMPKPEDFVAMQRSGFEVVINLALPTSDDAVSNEGELVSAQGMTYVHIPVKFEAPQTSDFERFSRMLRACDGQKVFVHCAANFRVSAFVFLHRVRHGADRSVAEQDLTRVWEPDDRWREFLNNSLLGWGLPPLQNNSP
ncbi:MAG: protein tyrosine phosphatase family protein [Akkermansiaceae bacterium]|nr:protein tyrosine phosphatase family protein [Verrucomicrobiales bacterium]